MGDQFVKLRKPATLQRAPVRLTVRRQRRLLHKQNLSGLGKASRVNRTGTSSFKNTPKLANNKSITSLFKRRTSPRAR